MRKLEEVIDKMLAVIPAEEDLRATLEDHKSSTIVSAPELLPLRWRETAMDLEDYFCETVDGEVQPPKLEEGSWQKKVYDIWMNLDG